MEFKENLSVSRDIGGNKIETIFFLEVRYILKSRENIYFFAIFC